MEIISASTVPIICISFRLLISYNFHFALQSDSLPPAPDSLGSFAV